MGLPAPWAAGRPVHDLAQPAALAHDAGRGHGHRDRPSSTRRSPKRSWRDVRVRRARGRPGGVRAARPRGARRDLVGLGRRARRGRPPGTPVRRTRPAVSADAGRRRGRRPADRMARTALPADHGARGHDPADMGVVGGGRGARRARDRAGRPGRQSLRGRGAPWVAHRPGGRGPAGDAAGGDRAVRRRGDRGHGLDRDGANAPAALRRGAGGHRAAAGHRRGRVRRGVVSPARGRRPRSAPRTRRERDRHRARVDRTHPRASGFAARTSVAGAEHPDDLGDPWRAAPQRGARTMFLPPGLARHAGRTVRRLAPGLARGGDGRRRR